MWPPEAAVAERMAAERVRPQVGVKVRSPRVGAKVMVIVVAEAEDGVVQVAVVLQAPLAPPRDNSHRSGTALFGGRGGPAKYAREEKVVSLSRGSHYNGEREIELRQWRILPSRWQQCGKIHKRHPCCHYHCRRGPFRGHRTLVEGSVSECKDG